MTKKELAELTNYVTAKTTDKAFTKNLVRTALKSYLNGLYRERRLYDWGCPIGLETEINAYRRAIKSFE